MNTEITLPVSELKSVLPGLSKVISRRATLPVLSCVRVESSPDQGVTLQATDLDDYATVRLKDAACGRSTAFLVPWEPLAKAVKNSASKESIVLVDEGKKGITLRTFIGSNPVDQKLDSPELKEWPTIPVITDSGIVVDQELKRALRQAFECASQDESRLILNTALLDVSDPAAHYVVGTNARALFSANSFSFDLKKSLIIPSRKFLGWAGVWEDETCRLSHEPGQENPKNKIKGDGWIQFRTDKWTFITKEIDGSYPNWRQIVPSIPANTVVKLSQDALESLLEVIPKLPGKEVVNSPLTLLVSNNHLLVEARTKDDHRTTIPIDGTLITGKNLSVSVNREYLVRALQFGLSELHLFDSKVNVMVCQALGRKLIIAVLQLDGPAKPATQPTSAAPSDTATQPEPQPTEERTDMSKTAATPTAPITTDTPANDSAIKQVIQQVEKIKDALKDVLGEFSDVLASLKQAEKEKKASDKEIESIRSTLRTIQNVKI